MLRQGPDSSRAKKVLVKMINRHALEFEKYNANNRDLIQQILTQFVDVIFPYCVYVYI